MKATIIYPKGNLGNTEQRFDIEFESPVAEKIAIFEHIFRIMNNVTGEDFELPPKLKCRSMSVGDIILFEDEYWMAKSLGWRQLDNHEHNQEYDWEFIYES